MTNFTKRQQAKSKIAIGHGRVGIGNQGFGMFPFDTIPNDERLELVRAGVKEQIEGTIELNRLNEERTAAMQLRINNPDKSAQQLEAAKKSGVTPSQIFRIGVDDAGHDIFLNKEDKAKSEIHPDVEMMTKRIVEAAKGKPMAFSISEQEQKDKENDTVIQMLLMNFVEQFGEGGDKATSDKDVSNENKQQGRTTSDKDIARDKKQKALVTPDDISSLTTSIKELSEKVVA